MCFTWSDEDSTSNLELDEEHLSNYVAFTSEVNMVGSKSDTKEDFKGESDVEFLKPYNTILDKWELVFNVNFRRNNN